MPLPVPVSIASGFSDAVGSAYRLTSDLLYVADARSASLRPSSMQEDFIPMPVGF
ncbi:MAG TPA: hypothetical protein VJ420_05705 [Candidatus Udaeobacter sp.]|nr:hypothetical protein [Candidatus Udaeobacter sp.]